MRYQFFILVLSIFCFPQISGSVAAATYRFQEGSTFGYFPSGEGPGIPGCSPNSFECRFHLAGTFDWEVSATLEFPSRAWFRNVDLQLIGNEQVQAAPPLWGLVTKDRLEALLEGLVMLQLPTAAPTPSYEDNGIFVSTNSSSLTLFGGRDSRPVDGDGFAFQATASIVPEPNALWHYAILLLTAVASRRRK
ncbi:MAG: hypothetical protein O3C60_13045 [Planctomycetota bacterium]|nr:hypothetical protein [Planctomycetota bacterium]